MRLSSSSTRRMRRCKSGMLRHLRNRGGLRARRKAKRKRRATLPAALGRDVASVHRRNLLDDRQTEAGAFDAIRTTAAEERLEQMRQIARGDARTAVLDADDDAAAICGGVNRYPLAFGTVADSVADEILHGASERRGI